MAGRIITLQRQARELGRLRTGYTDTTGSKGRPVRSSTWIVTSHSRDYCQAAADIWGGTVEQWQPQGNGAQQHRVITQAAAVDAILPPGDPLSQAYESWSRGGCQRRCDGETELLSDQSCLCREDWGPDWHKVATARDGACSMTTRLGVILPELPDLGVWRMETHSYYAANEITAAVDVLKGQLGAHAMIPIRLRIEPRTRVAQGKTKQFPVVALELRGATAGQVLSGEAAATIGAAQPRPAVAASTAPAIEAAARDWLAELAAVHSTDELRALWSEAVQADAMTADLEQAMKSRAADLGAAEQARAVEAAPTAESGVDETDAVWMQCVAAAPSQWSTWGLMEAYAREHGGELSDDATAEQLRAFLAYLKSGKVVAA